MLTCNCTLAGTKACENCEATSGFYSPFMSDFNWVRIYPWVETYNPETHELVEKKETKINRIKADIAKETKRIKSCNEVFEVYGKQMEQSEETIKKLEQELKELE